MSGAGPAGAGAGKRRGGGSVVQGAPLSAAQLHVVVTLGFCGLVSAADNWFVSPALPAIAHTLAVAPVAAAVILTAYMIPYGGLQPVYGALGDRVGRLRLLRIIVFGLAAGTALCALAPSLELLAAARVVTGCFAAGIITVSQAFVGDVVAHGQRGRAVGILMGITFTGQGLSAGLGGLLTEAVGWRAAFWVFAALALVAWGLLFALRMPGEPAAVEGAQGADVHAPAAGPSAAAGPSTPTDRKVPTPSAAQILRQALLIFFGRSRAVFLLACSTGVLFLGVYGFMGTFLAERCGLGSTQAGFVMMLYGVLCLVGGSLAGGLGARRGLACVVRVGECSAILAVAALVVTTLTGAWGFSLVAAACLGLGYILVQPTLVTLSMDADPEHVGLCTGLVGFGVFVGGGVGSALGGVVLGSFGYLALWLAAGAGMAVQYLVSRRSLGA